MPTSRTSKADAGDTGPQAKTTDTADDPVEEVPPVGENAPPEHVTVPVTQLIEQSSEFIGYPTHTAMGALGGKLDEEMTPDQAKAEVEKWLEQPVQVDGEEE